MEKECNAKESSERSYCLSYVRKARGGEGRRGGGGGGGGVLQCAAEAGGVERVGGEERGGSCMRFKPHTATL